MTMRTLQGLGPAAVRQCQQLLLPPTILTYPKMLMCESGRD